MGLFNKKKNDYEEASKRLNETVKASDKIVLEEMEDSDQHAARLVDSLKRGYPLVLNFGALEPTSANKLLAFMTGACHALDGKCITINETTYLFARKIDFLDGSLQAFLDQIPD